MNFKALSIAVATASALSACNIEYNVTPADPVDDQNAAVEFTNWQLTQNGAVVCSDDINACNASLNSDDQLTLKLAGDVTLELDPANLDLAALMPELAGQTSVATWKYNLPAAFAMQHDDWCGGIAPGLYTHVLPEIQSRGLKSSIGIIAGNCSDLEWQQAGEFLAAGFSIFNHSMTHVYPDAPSWDANAVITWDNQVELTDSNALIDEKTGFTPTMHGIPFGLWRAEHNNYIKADETLNKLRAATFVDGGWKPAFGINSANFSDPYDVLGNLYDDDWGTYNKANEGAAKITAYLDDTIAQGGFGLQYFHGVQDGSYHSVPLDEFQAAMDYVKTKADEQAMWLDHAETIIDYRFAREYCSLALTAIPFGFQATMDTSSEMCQSYQTELTVNLSNNAQVILLDGVNQTPASSVELAPSATLTVILAK